MARREERRKVGRIKVKKIYSLTGRGGMLSNTDFCSGIISSFSGTGSRLGGAGSVTGGKSSVGNSVITLNPVASNEDGDDEIELIVVADASSTDNGAKSAAILSVGRVAAALLLALGGFPVTSCISNLQSHFEQLLPHNFVQALQREIDVADERMWRETAVPDRALSLNGGPLQVFVDSCIA